jgi:hypothetical protein
MKFRSLAVLCLVVLAAAVFAFVPREPQTDSSIKKSSRNPEKNGWIYVHLEGTPSEIGYQHGYQLAPEIADLKNVIQAELQHDTKKNYDFFRTAAKDMLWPHIESEYRQELEGIAAGVSARGGKVDVWDIVVMNASIELGGYYNDFYNKLHGIKDDAPGAPEHCSAFVATGSYTRDGNIVIAHNNWSAYLDGERWRIIFDVVPAKGQRFIMDGLPGWIHSGDDFGVNAAGLAITETTITRFNGFDPNKVPEFVRARKAMQYATSIDEFASIMKEGNNGGYANNWLVADRKTKEVADLELGLKNVNLRRTKDGFFVGTNFPVDAKLAREETDFDLTDKTQSPNARKIRAEQLVDSNKGKIDAAFAKRYLADHYDSYEQKEDANERTICGHIDLSPRGAKPWQPEWAPAGAVENKVADAAMVAAMSFEAAAGHACGRDFKAASHVKQHPEFAWQKDMLRDMNAEPWTRFTAR